MIPFNRLGWIFHTFGSLIYPTYIKERLCHMLSTLPEDAEVLDIGAGTGILCQFASSCRKDLQLYAIDPAEGMLKYSPTGVNLSHGTAESLPYASDHFDALMIGEALHHFSDIASALSESVRVLKEGGRLFVYDFDPSHVIGKLIANGEVLLGEPGHFFPPDELKKILEKRGFEVMCYSYGFRYVLIATLKSKISYSNKRL